MAVYNPLEPGSFSYPYEPDSGKCSKCGDPMTSGKPCVVWNLFGQDDFLNLHPECAKELALHLAKDGLLAETLAINQGHR